MAQGVTNLCRNSLRNLFKLRTTCALLCFLKTCFTKEHKANSSGWSEKMRGQVKGTQAKSQREENRKRKPQRTANKG